MNIIENVLKTIFEYTALLLYIGFIVGVIVGFVVLKLYDLIQNGVTKMVNNLNKKLKEKSFLNSYFDKYKNEIYKKL